MTGGMPPTVLVVDDETLLVDMFEEALSREFDVRTATSGAQALRLADAEVDVLLLDRRMPDMSGDDVLEKLSERGFEAQVAMVSAVNPDTDILEKSIDEYVTKPITPRELSEVVKDLLRRATYDEQTREYCRLSSLNAALEGAGHQESEALADLQARLDELRSGIPQPLEQVRE